ncbi:MAG: hypothetical protein AAF724_03595 [Pseudomonadota bacterium]
MKKVYAKAVSGAAKIASFLSVTRSTRPRKLPEPRYPFPHG